MKKNGIVRWTVLALLVCCILCGLSACSFLNFSGLGNESKNKELTVTVHIEGYEVTDFVNKTDYIIKKPDKDPVKEGYEFIMWCSDEECTQELPYGEKLVSDIEKTVYNLGVNEISSDKIGDEVMKGLKNLDEVAYVRFASVYKEFKDIDTFLSEIERILGKK